MAKNDKPDMLPAMAALAIKGGEGDERLKSLLIAALEDSLQERQKRKEQQERLAKASIEATKEYIKTREEEIARCDHRKQDGSTRLSGQRLSGTGQICLVCKKCGADFFDPALEGQRPVPKDLWPSADEIGG